MSNEITLSNEFAVARTSKAGKTTYRGALGAITSGNPLERAALGGRVAETLIANNNYRALMREVCRVFPLSAIKKAHNVSAKGEDVYFVSQEGERLILDRFDASNPNKSVAHQYARAIQLVTAGKELKGEKKIYADILAAMLQREQDRIEALAAERALLAESALQSPMLDSTVFGVEA